MLPLAITHAWRSTRVSKAGAALHRRRKDKRAMKEQVRRAARLVAIEALLRRNPGGLTTRELAERTGYTARTIQRDISVLGDELGVPLMDAEGRRYRLMPGSTPIGAVRFSLQEA